MRGGSGHYTDRAQAYPGANRAGYAILRNRALYLVYSLVGVVIRVYH